MTRSTFRNCFISAPFGTDTAELRNALERKNVSWRDPTTIESGANWIEALDDEMSRADFICVVVPDEKNANVLFELGMAVGKKKPILAFVRSSVGLPLDTLTYFLLSPTNVDEVDRALDTFLQHSKPGRRRSKKPVISKSTAAPVNQQWDAALRGVDAEERTAALLRRAGFIVSEQGRHEGKGADLAVWIDELESSLGGPLLVEVKSGELTPQRLTAAENQLREYVAKTHGKFGLLVYWGSRQPTLQSFARAWPFILKMSGEELGELVERGEFTKELTRLRNAAVHGKV